MQQTCRKEKSCIMSSTTSAIRNKDIINVAESDKSVTDMP